METEEKKILGRVPYKILMQMHQHYLNGKHDHLSKHYKREETKSVWFAMTGEFIQFLKDLQDPANNVSGLRVYICEHDKDTIPPGCDPKMYVDKLTVGFVATKHNDKTGKEDDEPGEIKNIILSVDPYDQGKICPPDICP